MKSLILTLALSACIPYVSATYGQGEEGRDAEAVWFTVGGLYNPGLATNAEANRRAEEERLLIQQIAERSEEHHRELLLEVARQGGKETPLIVDQKNGEWHEVLLSFDWPQLTFLAVIAALYAFLVWKGKAPFPFLKGKKTDDAGK